MDNTPNEAEAARKGKLMRTARVIWAILIPVLVVIICIRLYSWSQGKDGLREILSPLGMICVGLANIFTGRNKTLSTIFVALGLILVTAGLVTLFVY
jgi:uncharacterized membrane protein